MPLTNKYLKYSPEITLEVFTLIWNKLIQCNWKNSLTISSEYSYFKSWGFLTAEREKNQFGAHSGIENLSETTVQEILGYDPFAKEEFILPEKWCIKRNKENYIIINNWFKGNNYGNPTAEDQYIRISNNNKNYDSSFSYDKKFKNYTEITFDQFKKYVLKESTGQPKQPLKQVIHCKTQEEWDFVSDKIGYKFTTKFELRRNDTINPELHSCESKLFYERRSEYKLLSFQEWCDLNRYKMEKEMILDESHIGKLISLTYNNRFYDEVLITKEYRIGIYLLNNVRSDNDGHPNKSVYKYSLYFNDFQEANRLIKDIKFLDKPVERQSNQKFKVGDWVVNLNASMSYKINEICKISLIEDGKIACEGKPTSKSNQKDFKYFRHATPEEINNHLISIGQIPAGEPLNIGIEPNKDGAFKYTTLPGSSWSGLTPTNHLEAMYFGDIMDKPIKTKMILSIDDEELPMVNIIKTNTIKQLLNND